MDWWPMAYENGWATKAQVHEACKLKLITPENYKTITGEEYV